MIELIHIGSKISITDCINVEKELGLELPDSFKQFLVKTNGGTPLPNYIELRLFDIEQTNSNIYISVDRFLKLNELPVIWSRTKQFLFPHYLLPIAEVAGGMLLCINFSIEKSGRVFYFDFDFGEIELGTLETLFSDFISEDAVDYEKYGIVTEDPIEQVIISSGNIKELEKLIADGWDFSKVIPGYDSRLIEMAVIFAKFDMLKYIHKSGSEFYNSLAIAEDNLEMFKGEGYEEIIEYIKTNEQ